MGTWSKRWKLLDFWGNSGISSDWDFEGKSNKTTRHIQSRSVFPVGLLNLGPRNYVRSCLRTTPLNWRGGVVRLSARMRDASYPQDHTGPLDPGPTTVLYVAWREREGSKTCQSCSLQVRTEMHDRFKTVNRICLKGLVFDTPRMFFLSGKNSKGLRKYTTHTFQSTSDLCDTEWAALKALL